MAKSTRYDGPLTGLQRKILQGMSEGKTQGAIAGELNLGRQWVTQNMGIAIIKMNVTNSWEACARWSTAQAYTKAARELEAGLIRKPQDPAEEHVNHVLADLAKLYRERAADMLPR